MTVSETEKRTTVRSNGFAGDVARAVTRAAFQVGMAFAPEETARRAGLLFLTPRRHGRAGEPKVPPGTRSQRGTLQTQAGEVTFWSFGEGPANLFVHGWEGRGAQFSAMAEAFLARGQRVVLVDLPGHGASAGRLASVVHFARALVAVVRVIGPVQGLTAHSLGAPAAALASMEGVFAERMVLLAPAAEPRSFVDRAADGLGIPPERRGPMYRMIEERVGRAMDEVDLRNHEGALSAPLLVLHDPKDREVPFEHGEIAARLSRHSTLERVDGLGHRRLLRDPAVIDRVATFVTGVSAQDLVRSELDPATTLKLLRHRVGYEKRSGSA